MTQLLECLPSSHKEETQCPVLHKLGMGTLERDQEDHSEFMVIWELES